MIHASLRTQLSVLHVRHSLTMSRLIALILTAFTLQSIAHGDDLKGFPGKVSDFAGYARHDFVWDGLKCRVVLPKKAATGKPWIWRARFFGHRKEVDVALLAKGYHVAFVDVSNLYGSAEALKRWDAFYAYLTDTHGFHKKPALEGMSRGGLIIFNWASENTDKVSCIYADAPVCDFKSWPGGKMKGKGSPGDWQRLLKVYGLSDEEAMAYDRNPIDRLEALVKAEIPLIHVVGDTDQVVPVAENTEVIEKRYKQLGGSITVLHKAGVGHKHGLDDPTPVIEFILKHSS